jgi:hypothetical protein
MQNRMTFVFAATLFLTASWAAKADMLDTIKEAPNSAFQFFQEVLASNGPQQNPVPAELSEAPPKPRRDRRRWYCHVSDRRCQNATFIPHRSRLRSAQTVTNISGVLPPLPHAPMRLLERP